MAVSGARRRKNQVKKQQKETKEAPTKPKKLTHIQ
jgi:hypothetical protein